MSSRRPPPRGRPPLTPEEERIERLNAEVVRLDEEGRFEEAVGIGREAVRLARLHPRENGLDLAASLENLAGALVAVGAYVEAETCYREAVLIHLESPVLAVRQAASALNSLGWLAEEVGAYVAAEQYYRMSLDLLEEHLDDDDPQVAIPLNNLGRLHQLLGDHESADRMLSRSLRLRENARPLDARSVARGLNNLAELRRVTGHLEDAMPLYRRALDILDASPPSDVDALAATLNNLGEAHREAGRPEAAIGFMERALDLWRARHGPGSLLVASAISNVALARERAGDLDGADEGFRQALAIRLERVGDRHPDVSNSLVNLGLLRLRRGATDEALEMLTRAMAIDDLVLGDVVSMGSERQVMAHLATLETRFDAYLSMFRSGRPHGAEKHALSVVLRRKAVGVEALGARQALALAAGEDVARHLDGLRSLRGRIARTLLDGPAGEPDGHRRRLEEMQAQRDRMEAELARMVPQAGFPERLRAVDADAVARALPAGSVLVEVVRFDLLSEPTSRGRYLAFVLPAAERANVEMIDLGNAEAIDRMIAGWVSATTGEAGDDGREASLGADLHAAVFTPLLPHLEGRTRLVIAPAGELARLPFQALPANGGRLIDRFHISYVGSGRDLLRPAAPARAAGPCVVVADPDYDLGGDQPAIPTSERAVPARRSGEWSSRAPFRRLPGTRLEGQEVGRRLGVAPLMRGEALAGRVKQAQAPRVLHFATHGFFFPDQDRAAIDRSGEAATGRLVAVGRLENPLLRSGLALAGANAWDRGLRPPEEAEDGILTAEDVAVMALHGTELVVLSACETGLGGARFGDGVLGLRRSFAIAGARTVVMSLWKIRDSQTRRLMDGFYRRLLDGMDRSAALRESQLEVRRRRPHPHFWAGFICEGDAGPLPAGPAGRTAPR